ncbi:hypothetical protein Syn7502_02956 [Synechococcus sp. PCC 7502]|uniref:hypothetical protein n=1 Tax=Synechococcus sp. PCC 7502 TaxID=1173263 RepID=UPI00029FCFDE|nr:hypothetical protein [Synechococcus sp. PCC 7502]AFY74880.1 hypothetical protein Syn7502_02956 [Synechococcus sp. PCC 7502]
MDIHIIFTDTDVIISKKYYASWHEIQAEYVNYKTSLGAWSTREVIDFLQSEYQDLEPSTVIQVEAFMRSPDIATILTYKI